MKAKETAVIFIEFQNDFCTEGGKLYSTVSEEITRNRTVANAVRLLSVAREKGLMIIHCPFTLDRTWVEKHNSQGLLRGIYDNGIFEPKSWGHEIIKELTPREGEIVLEGKRTISAFSHTNLDSLLEFGGIKNLIVCGFLTNICAQATAWSAYDRGYTVRVIPSACGATDKAIQLYVEQEICPLFGDSMSVDEVMQNVQ